MLSSISRGNVRMRALSGWPSRAGGRYPEVDIVGDGGGRSGDEDSCVVGMIGWC